MWNCRLCGAEYQRYQSLSRHFAYDHADKSFLEYYDQHIAGIVEGHKTKKCLNSECDNSCNYKSGKYEDFCSKGCASLIRHKEKPFGLEEQWKDPEFRKNMTKLARRLNSDPNSGFGWRTSGKVLRDFRDQHEGMTPAEWKLWNNSRFRKLNPISQDRRFKRIVKGEGVGRGLIGPILDFSVPDFKLGIELDSYHNHIIERDKKRDEFLTSRGWAVLRFSNEEVFKNTEYVVDRIYETASLLPIVDPDDEVV